MLIKEVRRKHMAAEKSSLKRKPLQDCTNIITDTAAATSRRKPSSKSPVIFSRGNSSSQAPTTSRKSITSIGSNATTTTGSLRSSADSPNRFSRSQTRSCHDDLQKFPPPSIQGGSQNNPAIKEKEKVAMEEESYPSMPDCQQLSSSPSSDELFKSRPSSIQDERQNNQRQKDNGKAVVEDFTTETSHPLTPSCQKLSSSAASGTINPLTPRMETTYTRGKVPKSKKHVEKKLVKMLSCPSKRTRGIRNQLNDESGDASSGPRTYPCRGLKKRSRDAPLHDMPKEEVEKLKAYYADIDAFELPVEEADDRDLD